MSNERFTWMDLLPSKMIFAEDEDEPNEDEDEPSGTEDASQQESTPKEGSPDNEGGENGLTKALQAERKRAREAERELKRLRKAEEDRALSEKSELEQAQAKLQDHETRAKSLADALLNRDLNDAIRRAAEKLKYIDVSDALDGVDRNNLDYEQDEDDPTKVTIDAKSVEREVKALATKKPHFLQPGTSDGQPTGSGFGGTQQKADDKTKSYREKYPSLN